MQPCRANHRKQHTIFHAVFVHSFLCRISAEQLARVSMPFVRVCRRLPAECRLAGSGGERGGWGRGGGTALENRERGGGGYEEAEGAHGGAVCLEKRHQKEGLRVVSRLSWMRAVRARYMTATTSPGVISVIIWEMGSSNPKMCHLRCRRSRNGTGAVDREGSCM